MSETRTEKEIIAEAYSDEAAKNWRAPVQGYPNGIPWALHLEAYQATPADQLMGAEPVAWTMKDSYGCDYITMSKHQAALWPKKTPLYAAQPAPADQVEGSEDWAATWHKTAQTICTIIGINGNGSPEEILEELQAKSSEAARAKRLQTALGHEGVYIHDATAERAIRAALATATPEGGE